MHSRTVTGCLLAALIAVPTLGVAEEPQGRSRTWDIEANLGFSIIDTGFDAKVLGYELVTPELGTNKIPPTQADHLETSIPTVGLRFGYSFTRAFALELGTVIGRTSVGSNTHISLQENFAINPSTRKAVLRQQTATAPQILAAYETLDFDYSNTDLNAVFKFNNKVHSKFVFYGTLGGGYLQLNPNSTSYNSCNDATNNMVFDANVDPYNGDPNAPIGSDPPADLFEDNPQQLRVDPGCGRGFLVATQTRLDLDQSTGLRVPVIVVGAVFKDADPTLSNSPGFGSCPSGQIQSEDPDTGQISCDGEAQWQTPPGVLASSGFATTGKVNGFEEFFYSAGVGMRWHLKPRHVLRFDARRSFVENGNKNSNQFTVGYSFVLGRGKPDEPSGQPPLPDEMFQDDDGAVPPPDDGEVPPPAEDGDTLGLS